MRPPPRRRARVRGLLVALAGLGALGGAWAAAQAPAPLPSAASSIAVASRPVPLDRSDPGRDQIGALTYLGGVQLLSEAEGFGGYSGLRLLPDGRLLAVSDRGHWLAFRPVERGGRLTGIAEATRGALRDEAGEALDYPFYDAEALEVLPGSAGKMEILVAFEQRHRIWRYSGPEEARLEQTFRQRPQALPDWLEGWPGRLSGNGGVEAMAVDARGAALLLAEDTGEGRFRLHADAPWTPIRYGAEPGFKPTDAAFLPVEGRHLALVLNRYFSILHGVAARLELVDLEAADDGRLKGRLLARLAPPVSVDNMEAVAVAPAGGGWAVYLMADDNRNPLQRTLLLKFHLPAGAIDP